MNEVSDDELNGLRAAQEPCAGRIEYLAELLSYSRRHSLPEEEHNQLHQELLRRLQDTSQPIPTAVATHLLFEDALEDELKQAAVGAHYRRVQNDAEAPISDLRTAARALGVVERFDEAIALWERVQEREPSQSSIWKLVSLYEHTAQWGKAARALQLASEGNSELANNYWTIRVIQNLVAGEEYEEALRLIDQIDASKLPLANLAVDIGWAFRDAGSDENAERLFRVAASVEDNSSQEIGVRHGEAQRQAQLALAHLYAGEGEKQQLLAAALDLGEDEEDPFALYERGTELLTSGQLEPAFDLLSRAAPGIGDLEAAWFNLALTAYRLERWSAAAEAYGQAAEINGSRPDVWFFRGLALVNLQSWSDAAVSLEKALELDPSRSLAHYHLTKCYAELGNTQAASRHLQSWNDSKEQR